MWHFAACVMPVLHTDTGEVEHVIYISTNQAQCYMSDGWPIPGTRRPHSLMRPVTTRCLLRLTQTEMRLERGAVGPVALLMIVSYVPSGQRLYNISKVQGSSIQNHKLTHTSVHIHSAIEGFLFNKSQGRTYAQADLGCWPGPQVVGAPSFFQGPPPR